MYPEGTSMMRFRMLPVLMFITILAIAGTANAQIGTIFRGFIWGVGMDDVRAYEKGIFFEQVENSLVFLENKKGRRSLIRYDFNGDKLWRAKFEYVDLHYSTSQKVLDVVIDEQAKLTRRFGKPVAENLIWKNSRYRNHPKFFTRAYGSGDVTIQTEWQMDDTFVRLESFYSEGAYQLYYTLENRAAQREMDRERTFQFYESLN